MTNTEVPVPVSNTIADHSAARRSKRTIELGRVRQEIERARSHTMKAARAADELGAPELHKSLMLTISTLDDGHQAITDAHLTGGPVELAAKPIDQAETLRSLLYSIESAMHGHPDPEALRRIRSAADRAKAEVGR